MTVTNTAIPVLSGTFKRGQTVHTTNGEWTFDPSKFLSYGYQWERCDAAGANCVNITGAVSADYTIQAADVGSTLRSVVTATENDIPTPPPGDAYFVGDYSGGTFASPWTLLFSYSNPGFFSLPLSETPDHRCKIVPDPAGSGVNVARFEIRDSDPGWASNTALDKSQMRTDTQQTYDMNPLVVGTTRWFSMPMYLPYTVSEKFEWAHGGSQPFTSMMGLHTGSPTGWSAFGLVWEAFQINQSADKNLWLNFHVEGGNFPETTYAEFPKLVQITDGNANRIMANHNRWIDLIWGMKFAPDNTGWLEIWVDGVNVYPRKSRPTMWAGDTTSYLIVGPYKRGDSTYPSGVNVMYYGQVTIGPTRPF